MKSEKSKARKLTQKQENFCLEYQKTGNASHSYRTAYGTENMAESTVNQEACRLKNTPHISARIEELKESSRKITNVTIDSLTGELNAVLAIAMENPKGITAAVSAIMGKAKLHGLLIEKSKVESNIIINVVTGIER